MQSQASDQFAVTHTQLCAAVDRAVAIERSTSNPWPARDRLVWLTEAELVARTGQALISSGAVPQYSLKVVGSGRNLAGSGAQPDIAIGQKHDIEVQVVFAYAYRAASPGKPLADDFVWLSESSRRHVVAFLPRMVAGYGVQKNKTRYDLSHAPLVLKTGEHILTDCLQMGGLERKAIPFDWSSGVFGKIMPKRGKMERWSLVSSPDACFTQGGIVRSLIGNTQDLLWALVWSNNP
jgi:hypothetical protein